MSRVHQYVGLVGRDGDIEAWRAHADGGHSYGDSYLFTVVAYDRAAREFAGAAYCYLGPVASVGTQPESGEIYARGECARALLYLSSRYGTETKRAIVVGSSHVAHAYLRRGVGVLLYVAAAAVARADYRMAITSQACSYEGMTSDMAVRVWKSQRLQEKVEVIGRVNHYVGVYRGP